ncbi:hypothetical protein C162_26700 [Paenibacillus sp. FSL R7-269]|uniref:BC1872 family protein n=1 Tax=Paenibacillus sp. FSL R7-269 TaxID=1226755 RepID=UPI0003E2A8C2|nr:hypothetical protein [Paenibacillus sp. FSL R7-269]ETT40916.1 hypothetical protein C162_26700 [Paenibacillus sp. FSL R7-269]
MTRDEIIAKWTGLSDIERDAWIAEVVFGWEWDERIDGARWLLPPANDPLRWCAAIWGPEGIPSFTPKYSTDISAAANVLNAILGEFYLYRAASNKYVASFGYTSGEPCFDCGEEPFEIVAQGIAETASEAIGLAAVIYKLRGVGADVAV